LKKGENSLPYFVPAFLFVEHRVFIIWKRASPPEWWAALDLEVGQTRRVPPVLNTLLITQLETSGLSLLRLGCRDRNSVDEQDWRLLNKTNLTSKGAFPSFVGGNIPSTQRRLQSSRKQRVLLRSKNYYGESWSILQEQWMSNSGGCTYTKAFACE